MRYLAMMCRIVISRAMIARTMSLGAMIAGAIIFSSTSYALTLDEYAADPKGYVLFMRHALAPGTGDPAHFDINDCQTQRNLSDTGREQARQIGERLKKADLKIAAILTSQWCRCTDTAKELGLGPVTAEPGLNSFYQGIVPKQATLAQLREKLAQIDAEDGITVMVTHFVTIAAITDIGVSSGGMVSYNPQTGEARVIGVE